MKEKERTERRDQNRVKNFEKRSLCRKMTIFCFRCPKIMYSNCKRRKREGRKGKGGEERKKEGRGGKRKGGEEKRGEEKGC